jgi:hypothetical protein
MVGASVVVVAIVGLAVYSVGVGLFGGSEASLTETVSNGRPADYEYVIPLGTAEQIEQGIDVEILPAALQVHVGQTLQIVNRDDRSHLIGPFSIAAGQTVTQTFVSVGRLVGTCSIQPNRRFEIDVVE